MARLDAKDATQLYNEAKTARAVHENDWRMAAAYCLPRHYSSWLTSDGPANIYSGSQQTSRFAYDTTGVRALPKFVSILERVATPQGQRWSKLRASNKDLMKIHAVRVYFDELNTVLFNMRYAARARYVQATSETYASIGVYGMGPMSVTWRRPTAMDRRGGFGYKAWPMRDIFIMTDDEGNVDTVFRRFWLNARQFMQKFSDETPPNVVQTELKKPSPSPSNYFEFVHMVRPMADYDPKAIDHRRHVFSSDYLCVKDAVYVGKQSGFRSNPYLTPRTFTEPGDVYGYSPAMQALPALGGVSAMKKTMLKQGQKAVDPVMLAADDGVLSGRVDLRPGSVNYGGVDRNGRKMLQALETGNFQIGEHLINDERSDINDAFLVTIFQILNESPEMTATEVVERVAEKAALLAPTMGRLQSEFLGPEIEREIDLLHENGLLPEPPPELVEAEGAYDIEYTSPMAKGMYSEEIAGFMRSFEMSANAANAKQDPSLLDHYNFDVAIPEIADYLSVRTAWVNPPEVVAELRKARAEQQQQQQLLQQAPALASVAKAAMDKGMNV